MRNHFMIQDKSFNPDGSIFYPDNLTPRNQFVHPSVVRAFIGNIMIGQLIIVNILT